MSMSTLRAYGRCFRRRGSTTSRPNAAGLSNSRRNSPDARQLLWTWALPVGRGQRRAATFTEVDAAGVPWSGDRRGALGGFGDAPPQIRCVAHALADRGVFAAEQSQMPDSMRRDALQIELFRMRTRAVAGGDDRLEYDRHGPVRVGVRERCIGHDEHVRHLHSP